MNYDNNNPVMIKRWRRNFLGLVCIEYQIEDRRPNLEEYDSKYKHFLMVRVLWKVYQWTFRTKFNYADLLPYES